MKAPESAAARAEEEARHIVQRLSPSPEVAVRYTREVQHFQSLVRAGAWKLRKSTQFSQVVFLVGFTEDVDSAMQRSSSDACAVFERRHPWGPMIPHHVRCRPEDLRRRDAAFRGVLEHEFVHLCQYLSKGPIPLLVPPGAKDCVERAVVRVLAELEANLVQHALVDRHNEHRSGVNAAAYAFLRGLHPVMEELATLTPPARAAQWNETVVAVFCAVQARLVQDSPDLWRSVTAESFEALSRWMSRAWHLGMQERLNAQRPQP